MSSEHTPKPPAPRATGQDATGESSAKKGPTPPAGGPRRPTSSNTNTAEAATPATATSNPRVQVHQQRQPGSPSAATTGQEVVAIPRGGAVAVANQFRNNPGAMHDVDFYQSVASELPDSKVLHSILYTHRSVIEEGPTVDEQLATVKESAHSWELNKSAQVKELQEIKRKNLTEEYQQDQKDEEARLLEHTRVFQRLEEMTVELDQNIERSFDLENQELKQQRQAMEANRQKRKLALEQKLAEEEEAALQQRLQRSKIEEFAGLARTEMEELLHRGLNRTEEERSRIAVAFEQANEAQRIGLYLERVEWAEKLRTQEQKEASYIQTWIGDQNIRFKRLIRLADLKKSMNNNLMMSEQGERQNTLASEAVERIQLGEEYTEWLNKNRVGVSPKRSESPHSHTPAIAKSPSSSLRKDQSSTSQVLAPPAVPTSSSGSPHLLNKRGDGMGLSQLSQVRGSITSDCMPGNTEGDTDSPHHTRDSALSSPAHHLHEATSPPGSPVHLGSSRNSIASQQ